MPEVARLVLNRETLRAVLDRTADSTAPWGLCESLRTGRVLGLQGDGGDDVIVSVQTPDWDVPPPTDEGAE